MAERKEFRCSLEYDLGATAGESGVKTYKAEAQDICANGIRVTTNHPLEKGMVIRLGFPLSGIRMMVPAFAEVAWTIPAGKRYKAGLRFLK